MGETFDLSSVNWEQLLPFTALDIVSFFVRVIIAIVILWLVIKLDEGIGRLVKRLMMQRAGIDETRASFVGSLTHWGLNALAFVIVLQLVGVQTTSIVALLGATTLAIGLALQGALGNLAAGVMIMLFRPFKMGDLVETAGVSGTVRGINLFRTVLATPDNIQIQIPNSQAINSIIKNFSAYDERRCDLVFCIGYDDDAGHAIELIHKVLEADGRILYEPQAFVKVTALSPSSVDITLRAWVKAGDYGDAKFALTLAVKEAFDEAGITIPYPHQVMVQKKE